MLGVSCGSEVGGAFIILVGLHTTLCGLCSFPCVAFVTALISWFSVFRLANVQGKYHLETIILSGVVVSAFLGSFVSLMVSLSDKVVNQIVFWLMGSLAMQGWTFTFVLVPYLIIGFIVLIAYSKHLNLF